MVSNESSGMPSAVAACLDRCKRSKDGAAAAEFAIIFPVLLLIVAGALQFGVLMMTYNSMVNGARNAARSMSLGDTSDAEVKAAVRQALPGWVPSAAVTVTTQAVGTDRVQVDVSVPSANATVMRLLPMSDTLDVSIVMMRED